jgi:WD40 repeat protein/energy-coupling factor transporter ATP-binding protein EcfA2
MNRPSSSIEPFVGLRPFEQRDAHLFFGREAQVEELLGRLQTQRFVVVMGASGSGKSSLVRAGLIPALEGGLVATNGLPWRISIMRPGGNPIGNLAAALARACASESLPADGSASQENILEAVLRRGSRGLVDAVRESALIEGNQLLIVVDQFEELFRFRRAHDVEDASNHAAAFVKLLVDAVREERCPVYIMLTMRSDALGGCTEFRDLPGLINEGLYLIPRLNRDRLAEAIVGPAAVARATVSPSLVQHLLNDVSDDPDQLPVLQHALMRMWRRLRREGGTQLTLEHYEAIKGLSTALSEHADEAFAELDARQKRIAERAFKCLTERGPDNTDVRRPSTLGEICDIADARPEEVIEVLDHFRREGRSFVMPSGNQPLALDTFLDISHESLIRKWVRLQQWVSEESDDKKLFMRLSDSAAGYAARKEAPWRHPLLGVALDWRQRFGPTPAWARRYGRELAPSLAFLDVSRKAQNFRWYARRAGFALVVLAMAIGGFAYQRQQADAEFRKQETDLKIRTAELDTNRFKLTAEQATLKAEQAQLTAEQTTLKAREETLRSQAGELAAREEAQEKALAAKQAQEGARVAEALRDGLVLTVGERLYQTDPEARVLVSLHVLRRAERSGASDVAGDAEGNLRQGLQRLKELLWEDRLPRAGERLVASQQRSLVLASTETGGRLWDLSESDPKVVRDFPAGRTLVVSPGGRSMAWPAPPDSMMLWSADTGQTRTMPWGKGDQVAALASDLSHVVVSTAQRTELRSPGADTRRPLTANAVDRAAFSPDDTLLVTLVSGRLQLWQMSPFGKVGVEIPVAVSGPLGDLSFSPSGTYVTLTSGNRLWMWGLRKDAPDEIALVKVVAGQPHDSQALNDVAFSADERFMALAGASSRIRVITIRPSTSRTSTLAASLLARSYTTTGPVNRVAFSDTGNLVAATVADGTARVWRRINWSEIGLFSAGAASQFGVHEVAFVSAAGRARPDRLVMLSPAGNVRLWDLSDFALDKDRSGLVEQACSKLRRALTAQEWLLFFRSEVYQSPCERVPLDFNEVLKLQIEHARANRGREARESFSLPSRTDGVTPTLVREAAVLQFDVGNKSESAQLFRLAASLATSQAGSTDGAKAQLNNSVCWDGAIRAFATEVLDACHEAVKLAPAQSGYRDSRGVALALLGNVPGAIADFEAYVNDTKADREPDEIEKRRQWIKDLQGKQNPFARNPDKVLEDLRSGS